MINDSHQNENDVLEVWEIIKEEYNKLLIINTL
jgi:hypothetical protein